MIGGESMKIILVILLSIFLFSFLLLNSASAAGSKEHGTVGSGYVNQEDPVGPGVQPDWQD